MKACLILKPALVHQRRIGEFIKVCEALGAEVIDITSMTLAPEDLYRFYELQVKYPTKSEIDSYLEGTCVIVGLDRWINLTRYTKLFPIYFSADEEIGEVDCRFWFGG